MMLPTGAPMTAQHSSGMMMMPGQSGVPQQGMMMMHQGQPVMMQQGQMMMAPNQPMMYGNQIYYPAQGAVQYPAQSHVTGQYAQNTSTHYQQPSQFR